MRLVPGFESLQRMAMLLLRESVPTAGRILVLGAGGGLELKKFADAQPQWRFVGVDPSAEMLKLAEATLGAHTERVELHEGFIDTAPEGPFDAATCLLTLHFIPAEERLRTLKEIWRRLLPGAPLIVAHHSFPQSPDEKSRWLKRYAAYAVDSGVPAADAERAIAAISSNLPVLSPEEDERLLRAAGFEAVEVFYTGFTFKGWMAYKPA
ncbi:class I SAM-dependent methyltransferase [Pseudomonas sp. NPDC096950]|uniref:class I SAM-dependent methyltransferase n=1 Tax=Pseudomonas sp. NPDC096950 TaxID=3364485 RepID=UPI00383B3CED